MILEYEYFPYPDYIFGRNLKKIQENIDLLLEKDENLIMNLERFEVLKYFDDPNISLYKDRDFIEKISFFKRRIKQNIGIYFNSQFDVQEAILNLSESTPEYIDTSLQVIAHYKLDDKENDFDTILKSLPNRHLSSILQNKRLATKYQNAVSAIILKNPKNAEILIRVLNINSKYAHYTLPSNEFLSVKDINELILEYIKSQNPNLNYLEQIYQGKFSIEIETRVRGLAIDIYNRNTKEILSEKGYGITNSLEVEITELNNDLLRIISSTKGSHFNTRIEIDEKYLRKTLDYQSILQNMIDVLGLVDSEYRINAIPNNEAVGLFDRIFRLDDPNAYDANALFKMKDNQYFTMYMTYIKYLNQNEINILNVFKWYFEEFLAEEYGVENFELEVLDSQLPVRLLNIDLHAQFERIIKMYNLYSTYGEVNLKEVDIETNKKVNDLKSLNGVKYICLDSDTMRACTHHLFSDQSTLNILNEGTKFYNSLEDGKIIYSNLDDRLLSYVDMLIENSVVKIDNGFLTINPKKYFILKKVFFKSNINYFWTSTDDRKKIDEMIANKELKTVNSLFSKQEVDYFNYFLNDYFSNGLALRNKYSHGSSGTFTKEEHQSNYMRLCYLMTLFIMKVNEEITYKFDNSK